ncbi:unnamed protein product, partial [Allacma fusca]
AYKKKLISNKCNFGVPETEIFFRYLIDFVQKMGKADVPYFLLSWLTVVTHNDFNGLKILERKLYDLLDDSTHKSSFKGNNTVIIFMSDHGYRVGGFRESFLGYYEESLPFFFMRLPPHLKSSHPYWYKNLKEN